MESRLNSGQLGISQVQQPGCFFWVLMYRLAALSLPPGDDGNSEASWCWFWVSFEGRGL